MAPEGEAQVLRDLVSTHRNLCCDTFEAALEVSGFTQVQNFLPCVASPDKALEVSGFTQVQSDCAPMNSQDVLWRYLVLHRYKTKEKLMY